MGLHLVSPLETCFFLVSISMTKKLENEWFGGPKMTPKINIFELLGNFLVMLFSNMFLDGFLIDFGTFRTSKIELSPRREHDFHKIDVFKKVD